MKKKMLVLGIACALLIVGVVGSTFAAFQTTTKEIGKVDIRTKELKTKLHVKVVDENGKEVERSQKARKRKRYGAVQSERYFLEKNGQKVL